MADMSTLEVEADVSESSLAKIKVGQPCEITLDALPDTRFRGRISRMVPTVDRAKATVMTKVQFDAIDPRILPEMSAKVSFLSQEVTADAAAAARRRVARRARRRASGGTVLFAIRDGKAVEVRVVARREDRRSRRDHRRRPFGREGRAEAARPTCKSGHAAQGRAEVERGTSPHTADERSASSHAAARRRRGERGGAAGRDPRAHEVLRSRRPGHPGARRHQSRCLRGRLRRADGAVGLRQVDAAQPGGRHRQADLGRDPGRGRRYRRAVRHRPRDAGAPRTSASSSSSTT